MSAPQEAPAVPPRTKIPLAEQAYPQALRAREQDLLQGRGGRHQDGGDVGRAVGFGLSGGGIRSATFSLGVFQALAAHGLIREIDYLSTVSGGGYFGSFLGRLCGRGRAIRDAADVEQVLAPDEAPAGPKETEPPDLPRYVGGVLGWLRENGRYLAPLGTGDVMLAGAALLRNWTAVQVVMGSFALLLFVAAQLLHGVAQVSLGACWRRVDDLLGGSLLGVPVWASPYWLLAFVMFVAWAVPLGWAFWMISSRSRGRHNPGWSPLYGALLAAALGLLLGLPRGAGGGWRAAFLMVSVAAVLALVLRVAAGGTGWPRARTEDSQQQLDADRHAGNRLSRWLATALVATLGMALFALVDTFGQTIYALLESPGGLLQWAGGSAAVAAAAGAGANRLTALAKPGGGDRLKLPLAVLANLAAAALLLVLFTTIDLVSHGIAWEFRPPGRLPDGWPRVQAALFVGKADPAPCCAWPSPAKAPQPPLGRDSYADLAAPGGALALLLVFSLLFGRTWEFINSSSLQSLYGARLARAYLGASNPERLGLRATAVTETIDGDDITQADYWSARRPPWAPLHLVNVTVNETVDGRYQVQQQDRRGVGMAIGPAGLSAGIRHHRVLTADPSRPVRMFPQGPDEFCMFGGEGRAGGPSGDPEPEPLSLGQWVGISGAAVSTGLGARTNPGLSVLAGFANVRLGYWWDSGVARSSGSAFHRLFKFAFPVQSYFVDEFTASFRGSAQRHWYLTDGGHFENMAGYELIRRRLPVIVIVDGEEDADYQFGGLANLVRKARLDFGAEIVFLDDKALDVTLPEELARYFAPLPKLRRGVWTEEPVPDPVAPGKRLHVEAREHARLSLAHAALARVYYDGAEVPGSWLLYLKPTLTGDEPSDLLQYHAEHPAFPQESTAEQFFNEAQWESYRRLGQHIGNLVFGYARRHGDASSAWIPAEALRSGARPPG